MAPLLETVGLRVTAGGKEILRGVSLRVERGEFVSILGSNGAGKTTLLRALLGIVRPGGGEVRVDGRPLADWRRAELARRLSYVPQTQEYLPPFTVREFTLMGRYPHLSPLSPLGPADFAAADAALARAGATGFADRELGTLSGGERQRVMIAAALAQEAEALLLDEPTAFLDPHHQREVLTLLRELNRDCGLTVLAVTHDINSAICGGGRVIGLRDGAAVYDGPGAGLAAAGVLEAIYGAAFRFIEDAESGARYVAPAGMI